MEGEEVWLHSFLAWALDGGEWPAPHLGCFTTGERTRSTHCIGVWLSPRTCLSVLEKKNSLALPRSGNAGHPANSLGTLLTNVSQLQFQQILTIYYSVPFLILMQCLPHFFRCIHNSVLLTRSF